MSEVDERIRCARIVSAEMEGSDLSTRRVLCRILNGINGGAASPEPTAITCGACGLVYESNYSHSRCPDCSTPPKTSGAQQIADERARQEQLWGNAHDDEHQDQELLDAAILYATRCYGDIRREQVTIPWPWDGKFDKRIERCNRPNRLRALVKAGALIAAEIDREQRREKKCQW